jgi:hypothetical protein
VRSNQPPRIAAWLLRHFGSSPNIESVIGDLNESYGRGRSSVWYWRQVFIAIVESVLTDIRLHKLLVFRALVIGNVFKIVSFHSLAFTISCLARYLHVWERPNLLLLGVISTVVLCALNGKLLALLCLPHRKSIVFAFGIWQFITVIPFIGYIAAPFSWILEFDRRLYALLWNTQGMTALGQACDVCTSRSWYPLLLFCTGSFITMASLLLGSGVLTEDANNSEVQPRRAAT